MCIPRCLWFSRLAGAVVFRAPGNSPAPAEPAGPVIAPLDLQGPLHAAAPAVAAPVPGLAGLAGLSQAALHSHPSLREAAAAVEAARGKAMQAAKTPERCAAEVEVELALLALRGRYFTLLTQVRRARHDFTNRALALQANDLSVASLIQATQTARKLVEAKRRPRTDLLALEALLEETLIEQKRSRAGLDASWAQLTALAGAPPCPPPSPPPAPAPVPDFAALEPIVRRVLGVHTDLKSAEARVRKAGLGLEQALAARRQPARKEGRKGKEPAADPCVKAGKVLQAEAAVAGAEAAREAAARELAARTAEAF